MGGELNPDLRMQRRPRSSSVFRKILLFAFSWSSPFSLSAVAVSSLVIGALLSASCVAKPLVDPGVFVIEGVSSCRNGAGYCVLGSKCSVDGDFVDDDEYGHCDGLRNAFSPSALFVCCKYIGEEADARNKAKPPPVENFFFEKVDDSKAPGAVVHLVEVLDVVTDATGVLDVVTRPFDGTQEEFLQQPPNLRHPPKFNVTWLEAHLAALAAGGMAAAASSSSSSSATSNSHDGDADAVAGPSPLLPVVAGQTHPFQNFLANNNVRKVRSASAAAAAKISRPFNHGFVLTAIKSEKRNAGEDDSLPGNFDDEEEELSERIVHEVPIPGTAENPVGDPVFIRFPEDTPVQDDEDENDGQIPASSEKAPESAPVTDHAISAQTTAIGDGEGITLNQTVTVPSVDLRTTDSSESNSDEQEPSSSAVPFVHPETHFNIGPRPSSSAALPVSLNSDLPQAEDVDVEPDAVLVFDTAFGEDGIPPPDASSDDTGPIIHFPGGRPPVIPESSSSPPPLPPPPTTTTTTAGPATTTAESPDAATTAETSSATTTDNGAEATTVESEPTSASEAATTVREDEVTTVQDGSAGQDGASTAAVTEGGETTPAATTAGPTTTASLEESPETPSPAAETTTTGQTTSQVSSETTTASAVEEGTTQVAEAITTSPSAEPTTEAPTSTAPTAVEGTTVAETVAPTTEEPQPTTTANGSSTSGDLVIVFPNKTVSHEANLTAGPEIVFPILAAGNDDGSEPDAGELPATDGPGGTTTEADDEAATVSSAGTEPASTAAATESATQAPATDDAEPTETTLVPSDTTQKPTEIVPPSEAPTTTAMSNQDDGDAGDVDASASPASTTSSSVSEVVPTSTENIPEVPVTSSPEITPTEAVTQVDAVTEEVQQGASSDLPSPSGDVTTVAAPEVTVTTVTAPSEPGAGEVTEENAIQESASASTTTTTTTAAAAETEAPTTTAAVSDETTTSSSVAPPTTTPETAPTTTTAATTAAGVATTTSTETSLTTTVELAPVTVQNVPTVPPPADNTSQTTVAQLPVTTTTRPTTLEIFEAPTKLPHPIGSYEEGEDGLGGITEPIDIPELITSPPNAIDPGDSGEVEMVTTVPIDSMIKPQQCGIHGRYLTLPEARGLRINALDYLRGAPEARFGGLGFNGQSARIIGGRVTSTVIWCWMAAFMAKNPGVGQDTFLCSGALIENDLVVSTASCLKKLFDRGLANFRVVLGDSNLKVNLDLDNNRVVQARDIQEVIIHENYGMDRGIPLNDIGIAKLAQPIEITSTVCLLCLPTETKDFANKYCTVTGYGKSIFDDSSIRNTQYIDEFSEGVLRQASLPIMGENDCTASIYNASRRRASAEHPSLLCTGGGTGQVACIKSLDAGSPLACHNENGQYVLAGVLSYNLDCGRPLPSLYTRVSTFLRWIRINYMRMLGFIIDNELVKP